ncbi:hypothetical protein C1I63_07840 [Rathayibacter caricis DSM 15933]|uniref:Histidine kinase/HSP90-like ATPase domain-containing protein n=1 Tax=Rathayibacter caricis DSM 15933 TaxID=1328867 RepID=A0A2T4UTC3_9MICO|nr:ATP-binding protein [Rathayibacter caricis]PTL72766.1 hypothetical protein C1I63_07840 [Rathayibacter caricis DSM 15933]
MLPSTDPGAPAPPERAALRREQSDVGLRCARRARGVFTGASAVHLLVLEPAEALRAVPILLVLVLAAGVVLLPRRARSTSSARLVALSCALSLTALVMFVLSDLDLRAPTVLGCITMLASMALPTPMLALGASRRLPVFALAGLVPVLALSTAATWESGRAFFVALAVVVSWTGCWAIARWIAASVERADIGTRRLRTAHDAERRSSEDEARRRYDARLMHDTILATLSLVAHRGEGVPPQTLRERAAADLDLLQRLERSEEPPQDAPGDLPCTLLPERFAAVDRRYRALGLEISWHAGDGGVPAHALEPLARATGECLENVRRHSGVRTVDVTIEQDEREVRVAVSDAGAGFDPRAVPADRLGLAESVRGRLQAVGGSARVFSAPGAGTTVLMRVPR